MIKQIVLLSICILFIANSVRSFAEDTLCKEGGSNYCINVDIDYDSLQQSKEDLKKDDICFIVELNASSIIKISIPFHELPAVLFTMQNSASSFGKPLYLKILKVQIVPTGSCGMKPTQWQPVDCEVFEYATFPGVARFILLERSDDKTHFACEVQS